MIVTVDEKFVNLCATDNRDTDNRINLTNTDDLKKFRYTWQIDGGQYQKMHFNYRVLSCFSSVTTLLFAEFLMRKSVKSLIYADCKFEGILVSITSGTFSMKFSEKAQTTFLKLFSCRTFENRPNF